MHRQWVSQWESQEPIFKKRSRWETGLAEMNRSEKRIKMEESCSSSDAEMSDRMAEDQFSYSKINKKDTSYSLPVFELNPEEQLTDCCSFDNDDSGIGCLEFDSLFQTHVEHPSFSTPSKSRRCHLELCKEGSLQEISKKLLSLNIGSGRAHTMADSLL